MAELDATDRKILNRLQADGRITNAELAERVNLSPSACLRRVHRLEAQGVIAGYAMLVDADALGLGTTVFVEVTLTGQAVDLLSEFETAVREVPAVMECYLMAGDADYLLRVVVADVQDFERIHKEYLSRLPHVARIRSIFAMRTVYKSTAITL
ncbi:MAG: Lrp/AsnC family transcriptional regulator [Rhodospirillales bacterium]|nr:MAG: Lrp/AsnC family transcriptional regulator [Rhodospirillales bacterium]